MEDQEAYEIAAEYMKYLSKFIKEDAIVGDAELVYNEAKRNKQNVKDQVDALARRLKLLVSEKGDEKYIKVGDKLIRLYYDNIARINVKYIIEGEDVDDPDGDGERHLDL